MTLPSSGAISLANIAAEFGGSAPYSLQNYYAGGSFVGSAAANGTSVAIPSSGVIKFADFYGASAFTPTTTTFTTANNHTITIPTGCSSATFEIFGGGGGGGGSAASVVGNGAGSGGRCVTTIAITSAHWGQTFTLHCGAILTSTGSADNGGQTGQASTVVVGTYSGTFTSMQANGGAGGVQNLGGGGAGGTATGGNVTNTTGNSAGSGSQTGATGLTGTYINGLNGAGGANHPGGVSQPDTATTLGQGAVHFT